MEFIPLYIFKLSVIQVTSKLKTAGTKMTDNQREHIGNVLIAAMVTFMCGLLAASFCGET